jgi:hypothetical protein
MEGVLNSEHRFRKSMGKGEIDVGSPRAVDPYRSSWENSSTVLKSTKEVFNV